MEDMIKIIWYVFSNSHRRCYICDCMNCDVSYSATHFGMVKVLPCKICYGDGNIQNATCREFIKVTLVSMSFVDIQHTVTYEKQGETSY